MQSLSKILLPVDFSERSVAAARYARTLAAHFHSEVVLLHVLTPPEYEFGTLDAAGAMLADLYRSRSEQAARDLEAFETGELAGAKVRRLLLEGDPAAKVVQFAHDESVGIIIMPTHGYGPFRRFILGSNTAKVLHDADCPVWTGVHLEEPAVKDLLPIRNVLCAIDLGPQSSKTLLWAALLAREFEARLSLIHTVAEAPDPTDPSQANWLAGIRRSAEAALHRLQQSAGTDAEAAIEAGDPAKVICAAAECLPADILVIGRGSAAGVFGRLRTNAYAIIRQSPCPVVSV
ncbi:MAG TPA: universal stress protein [Bryobacteraceae bacterium]|nr:universal stress protein [Bryobacteraceae bacterium]